MREHALSEAGQSRVWTIGGAIGIAAIGMFLLLRGLAPPAQEPQVVDQVPTAGLSPTLTAQATPPYVPDDDPVVAVVDDHEILYTTWLDAILIDQVLSGLAGQPAPAPEETLERLIDETLVLRSAPGGDLPTATEVEESIVQLESTWGVTDEAVTEALEHAGLSRAKFERSVVRILSVQARLDVLRSKGEDVATWLADQRSSARILIADDLSTLTPPTGTRPADQPALHIPTPNP